MVLGNVWESQCILFISRYDLNLDEYDIDLDIYDIDLQILWDNRQTQTMTVTFFSKLNY